MTAPAADVALGAAMSDPEYSVRKAAVHTIPFRPIAGVLKAVDALLRTEKQDALRIEIVKGLSVKISEDPAVAESVEWALENDPSAQVKQIAQQILESQGAEEQPAVAR